MNRTFLILLLALALPRSLPALSCCVGGSTRSFVRLQRFQHYDFGVTSSLQDTYGFYNVYGDLERYDRDRFFAVSFGAAKRLNADWQISFAIPVSNRTWGTSGAEKGATGLGDIAAQVEWVALESLFRDEWYPNISLFGGVKVPTGAADRLGNGLWEPYAGLVAEKGIGPVSVAFRAAYTARLPRGDAHEGALVELSESVTVPVTRRIALSAGLTQTWRGTRSRSGTTIPDSQGRTVSAFFSPAYFVTQYVSLAAALDFTLPLARLGVNSPANQSFSLTARYAIY